MLGLNTITVDIQKIKYPVYFEHRNVCVHCGARNSLVFVDRFGNETTKETAAFEHIKCKRCKRIYSIRWDRDECGNMRPSAVDFSIVTQFNNFLSNDSIANDGIRVLQ